MGNEVTTSWLMEVSECLNSSFKLVPAKLYREKLVPQLEALGAEGFLKLAEMLGIGEPDAVRALARDHPHLVTALKSEEGQKQVREYAERNQAALEELRRKLVHLERVGRPGLTIRFQAEDDIESGANPDQTQVWVTIMNTLGGRPDEGSDLR